MTYDDKTKRHVAMTRDLVECISREGIELFGAIVFADGADLRVNTHHAPRWALTIATGYCTAVFPAEEDKS